MTDPTKVARGPAPQAPIAVDSHALVGKTIDGRYRLVEHIASGGMGAVFRAEHELMKKTLAVKILHPELADPDIVERFRREAQIIASLDHDHIVRVNDFGIAEEGFFFLVMEHLQGESLRAYLDRRGALSADEALRLLLPIASALAAAHDRGIVHRDLKPENVHLGSNGTIKVLDFGIAKIIGSDVKLTRAGSIIGTPRYIAPEQAAGAAVDARADVYALGLVAWRMLAGGHPFHDKSGAELLVAQATQPIPPLLTTRPDLAGETALLQLIDRACDKNPERRFTDGRAFRDALTACRHAPVLDESVHASASSARASSPKRMPIAGAGAAAAAAAVFALIAAIILLGGGPVSEAKALIKEGRGAAAKTIIERELAKHPDDVELRVLLGRALHASFGEELRGIQTYEHVLSLDASAAGDRHVLNDLLADLGRETKIASAAEKLLVRIGEPAVDAVADAAQEGHGFIRLRALLLLEDLKASDEVDRVEAFTALLADSECDVKRAAAKKLGELNDADALPKLRELANAKTTRRVLGLFDDTVGSCGSSEAAASVRKLEAQTSLR